MQPCKSVANYMTAFPIIPPQQYVLGCWAGYMWKKKKKNYFFYKFKQQKMKVNVRFLTDEDRCSDAWGQWFIQSWKRYSLLEESNK